VALPLCPVACFIILFQSAIIILLINVERNNLMEEHGELIELMDNIVIECTRASFYQIWLNWMESFRLLEVHLHFRFFFYYYSSPSANG
jgi:hypothetical protein